MNCIYCKKEIRLTFLTVFSKESYCVNCFDKFQVIYIKEEVGRYTLLILYANNDYVQEYYLAYSQKQDYQICTLFEPVINVLLSEINASKTLIIVKKDSLIESLLDYLNIKYVYEYLLSDRVCVFLDFYDKKELNNFEQSIGVCELNIVCLFNK